MEKTVKKIRMDKDSELTENLRYWLSRTPDERVKAVELLREQVCGPVQRMEKVVRIFKLAPAGAQALGRKKDLADLEALDRNTRGNH